MTYYFVTIWYFPPHPKCDCPHEKLRGDPLVLSPDISRRQVLINSTHTRYSVHHLTYSIIVLIIKNERVTGINLTEVAAMICSCNIFCINPRERKLLTITGTVNEGVFNIQYHNLERD